MWQYVQSEQRGEPCPPQPCTVLPLLLRTPGACLSADQEGVPVPILILNISKAYFLSFFLVKRQTNICFLIEVQILEFQGLSPALHFGDPCSR